MKIYVTVYNTYYEDSNFELSAFSIEKVNNEIRLKQTS